MAVEFPVTLPVPVGSGLPGEHEEVRDTTRLPLPATIDARHAASTFIKRDTRRREIESLGNFPSTAITGNQLDTWN